MKKPDSKQRLIEVMQRLNPNFTGKALNEGYSDLESGVKNDRHSNAYEDSPEYARKQKAWLNREPDPIYGRNDSFEGAPDEPEEVDEISTSVANAAAIKANSATNTAYNNDNPILGMKKGIQATKFQGYVNPELQKAVNPEYQTKPESSEGFSIYKADNGSTILSINPNPGQDAVQTDKILISVKPDGYSITNGSANQIPPNKLSKVMNFVKLIQADLKGEKSKVNPVAPAPVVAESPKFGGQNVSQDQYDELQYDKSTMEKAMGDAFKTPEGYQMKNPIKGGETFQLSDGDSVQVLSVEGDVIKVRVLVADEETKKYFPKGYFDISWSPVQFDAIVGNKGSVDEKFNKWGQSQDAWASIENGPANRGKDLQKKANLAKKSTDSPEVGSGNGSSHVPEYYYSYDSEEAIPNTNNLTQGQIDAMNDKRRNSMQQDVRRSMNRGDGGWSMDENKELDLPTKDGKSIKVSIPNYKEIFINGDPIEEILESVGDDEAVGNFPNGKISFNTYFDWITHRPGGVSEETFNNNRLFRVNIEYLVKAYDKYQEEEGLYESKEKFKFGQGTKKRLFEVMQRVTPNFSGKALNEDLGLGAEQQQGVKYRADVTGVRENVWSTNAKEYNTEEEAKAALDNLASRWFGFDMSRVVPTTTPTGQPVDLQNDVIYQNFRK